MKGIILLLFPLMAVGNDCSQLSIEQCANAPDCRKEIVLCDYVPKGKSFEDVCPHGSKYFVCREYNEKNTGKLK